MATTIAPKMQAHPLASLVPGTMMAEEFEALKKDIKKNGQRSPIEIYEGKVLDGRHRWRACAALGIVPKLHTFEGATAEAESFVISANLHRKAITPVQKALLSVKMINGHGMTYEQACDQYGISTRYIAAVRKAVDHNLTSLITRIDNGTISTLSMLDEELVELMPKPTKPKDKEGEEGEGNTESAVTKPRPKPKPGISTEAQKAASRFRKLNEQERIAFVEISWPHLKGAIVQAKSPDTKINAVLHLVELREQWIADAKKEKAKAKAKAARDAKKANKKRAKK